MKRTFKSILAYLLTAAIVMGNTSTTVFADEKEDKAPIVVENKTEDNAKEDSKEETVKAEEKSAETEVNKPAPTEDKPAEIEESVLPTKPEEAEQPKKEESKEEKLLETHDNEENKAEDEDDKFEPAIYRVTFIDSLNDEIIEEKEVIEGATCELPSEVPTHEGYEFVEWSDDFDEETVINEDLEINAIYEEITFLVTFIDGLDDNLMDIKEVSYKGTCDAPEPIEHEGYEFREWDTDYSEVTEDLEVRAEYDRVYKVVFIDTIDDVVLSESIVKEGETCDAPEIPEHKGYVFKEWSEDFTEITEDLEIKAIYEEEKPAFFENADGVTVEAEEGVIPEGTDLVVEEKNTNVVEEKVEEDKQSEVEDIRLYDIKLEKDGENVSPEGTVNITIDADVSDCESVFAFYKNGDNIEYLPATKTENGVMFATTHFSEYGVGGTKAGTRAVVSFKDKATDWQGYGYWVTLFTDKAYSDGKVTEPTTPLRPQEFETGVQYTFVGWFTDELLTNQFDFDNDTVASDISLYAKWDTLENIQIGDSKCRVAYHLLSYDATGEAWNGSGNAIEQVVYRDYEQNTTINMSEINANDLFDMSNSTLLTTKWYYSLAVSGMEGTPTYGDEINTVNILDSVHNSYANNPGYTYYPSVHEEGSNVVNAIVPCQIDLYTIAQVDLVTLTYDFVNPLYGYSRSDIAQVNQGISSVSYKMIANRDFANTTSFAVTDATNSKGEHLWQDFDTDLPHIHYIHVPEREFTGSGEPFATLGWKANDVDKNRQFKDCRLTEDVTVIPDGLDKYQFNITFDSQGGSFVQPQTISGDAPLNEYEIPTSYDGKTFAGWWKCTMTKVYNVWDSELGAYSTEFYNEVVGSYDTEITATTPVVTTLEEKDGGRGAVTLYAKWIDTTGLHKVTFDTDGGTAISPQYVANGKNAVKPADPIKGGYEFKYWKNKATGSKYNFPYVYSDVDLLAVWSQKSYTITLNANGGYFEPMIGGGSSAVIEEDTIVVTVNGGNKITFPRLREKSGGSSLEGWCLDAEGTQPFDKNTIITDETAPTILYAKWNTEDSYKITYQMVGCEDLIDIQEDLGIKISNSYSGNNRYYTADLMVGDKLIIYKFDVRTNSNCTFDIWSTEGSKLIKPSLDSDNLIIDKVYKDAACTEEWDFENDTPDSNMTLYAHVVDQIKVIMHDASGYMSDITFYVSSNDGGLMLPNSTAYNVKGTKSLKQYYVDNIIGQKQGTYWKYSDVKLGTDTTIPDNCTIFDCRGKINNWDQSLYGIGQNYFQVKVTSTRELIRNVTYRLTNANDFGFNTQGSDRSYSWKTEEFDNTEIINRPTDPEKGTDDSFTFEGWYMDAACTMPYDFTKTVSENTGYHNETNVILYGKFTQYKVSFDSKGGSAVDDQIITVIYASNGANNSTVTVPTAPTKENCDFGGWYTDEDCTALYNFNSIVNSNRTLYAGWTAKPQYKVEFNTDGGSHIADQWVYSGNKATRPTTPTKDNYDFVKWINSANGSDFDFDTEITENTVLKAIWNYIPPVYTVTFDSNGGSAVPSQNITEGNKVVKPANPSKDHYDFAKWINKANGSDWNFDTDTVNAALELQAVWNYIPPTTYQVTFDSDGGSAVDSQTVEESHKAIRPTDPRKDGHYFIKWVKKADNSDFDFDTLIDANIELKAVWGENLPNVYSVIFDTDGGNHIDTQFVVEGLTATAPADPYKTHYTFEKWVNKADNSDWSFATPITGDTELKAKYNKETYEIAFNTDGGTHIDSQFIEYEGTATRPANPEKDDFVFEKWVDESNNTDWDFTTPIDANVTLKAIYSAAPTTTHKVRFYATETDLQNDNYWKEYSIEDGQLVNRPTDTPVNPDSLGEDTQCTFIKWVNVANNQEWHFDTDTITDNVKLIALWKTTYRVRIYDWVNNLELLETQWVEKGDKIRKPATEPIHEGYTFAFWYWMKVNEDNVIWNFDTPVTQPILYLVAGYGLNQYTVTFNANGGTFDSADKYNLTVYHDDSLDRKKRNGENYYAIKTPTKANATFDGWYKDADLTQKWNMSDKVKGAMTLYAKWKENSIKVYYTVYFDSNGGTKVTSQSVLQGSWAVKPVSPSRSGYKFKGWYTESGKEFDFSTRIYNSMTLSAKWEKVKEVTPTPKPVTPVTPKPVVPITPTPITPVMPVTPIKPVEPIVRPVVPKFIEETVEPIIEKKAQEKEEPIVYDMPEILLAEGETLEDLSTKQYSYVEITENGYAVMKKERKTLNLYKKLSQRKAENGATVYQFERAF